MILEILDRHKSNNDVIKLVKKTFFDMCDIGINTTDLKRLLRSAMDISPNLDLSFNYSLMMFSEIIGAFDRKIQKEIFDFYSNEDSGIELVDIVFPKEGYLFFGWIRFENFYQKEKTNIKSFK